MSINFPGPANIVDPSKFKKGGSGASQGGKAAMQLPPGIMGQQPPASPSGPGGQQGPKPTPQSGLSPSSIQGLSQAQLAGMNNQQNGGASHLSDSQLGQLSQMYGLPVQPPSGTTPNVPTHPAFQGNQSLQQDQSTWASMMGQGGVLNSQTVNSGQDTDKMSFGQIMGQGVQDHINWLNSINSNPSYYGKSDTSASADDMDSAKASMNQAYSQEMNPGQATQGQMNANAGIVNPGGTPAYNPTATNALAAQASANPVAAIVSAMGASGGDASGGAGAAIPGGGDASGGGGDGGGGGGSGGGSGGGGGD